jgi:Short C-terminal domain
MPFMRRRPLLRAAMVGGVAYHAGKRVQEGRDDDYERDARIADLEQQQAMQQAAPPQQTGGGISEDVVAQLERLGKLKEDGVLTQAEFDLQKQKLLSAS